MRKENGPTVADPFMEIDRTFVGLRGEIRRYVA
jgi:hypothetical protein